MSTSGTYRETIGTTTRAEVERTVPRVLTSEYGYRFDRTITRSEYMRYFTSWRQHSILPEEKELGYTAARTRIEVIAQPRDRAAGTYTAKLNVEYSVRQDGSGNWRRVEIPTARQEYLDGIYEDLEDELTGGIM